MDPTVSSSTASMARHQQGKTMPSSSDSSSDSALLWKTLETCQHVIFPFLGAKSLSTFHLAILADYSIEAQGFERILRQFGNDSVANLCLSFKDALDQEEAVAAAASQNSTNMDDRADNKEDDDTAIVVSRRLNQVRGLVQRTMDILEPFLRHGRAASGMDPNSNSRHMSESMILWQALRWAHTDHDNNPPKSSPPRSIPLVNRLVEAPIWCGQIKVLLWVPRGLYHGFGRLLFQANVALLSPLWNQQSHLDAWESLGQHSHENDNVTENNASPLPTITMIVETYNFTTTAPIGRLVGLQNADRDTLQNIARRLKDQNTVAILSPQQQRRRSQYIRQVMVVSRSQARQRASRPQLPFCYYARDTGMQEQQEDDLVCCWQCTDAVDDTKATTLESGIQHWKRILETREKVLACGESENTPQGPPTQYTYQ